MTRCECLPIRQMGTGRILGYVKGEPKEMKFQFQVDGRAAGRERDTWKAAVEDAISAGYGQWTEDGNVMLNEQASIARLNFVPTVEMPPCIIRTYGDTTMCVKPGCRLRWDTNDDSPPLCPARAVAVQRRNARELGEAQRRLAALYSESEWPLQRVLSVGLGLVAPLTALGLAIAVLLGVFG